mgnify:CR=1 FL=1|jgi:hypothetical protein|tara:strand:+ start:2041 stop:2910 length:870 start_codon:yes stop_codon:yes gene_type:complete
MAKLDNKNPLAGHFRTPKLYTHLPSGGDYYTDDIIDTSIVEHAVFSMTAKDELIMKNPDALLNGDAVIQVLQSCIPSVKDASRLFSNDVDALLVAVQGATFGDDIEVTATCNKCEKEITHILSVEGVLTTMSSLKESYEFTTESGLLVKLQPFSYKSAIKAGIANFRSTRSLQSISDIPDEIERIHAFNDNFVELAQLNFELLVDSIKSITVSTDNENVIVSDYDQLREFMENCDRAVGGQIEGFVTEIGKIGIAKEAELTCEDCGTEDEPYVFNTEINFNPVNFFTAS